MRGFAPEAGARTPREKRTQRLAPMRSSSSSRRSLQQLSDAPKPQARVASSDVVQPSRSLSPALSTSSPRAALNPHHDLRPRLDGDEVHGDEESAGLPRGDAGSASSSRRLPLGAAPAPQRPDVAARVPVRPRRGGPVGPAGRAHRLPVHLLLDLLGAQPHGGGRLRPVDRRPAVVDPAGGVHAALVRRAAVAPRRADVRAHAHVGPPPHVQLCARGRLLGRRGLPLGRDPQVVQRAGLEVGGLQPRLHLLRPAGAPPPPPPPPPARPRRPHAFAPSLRRNR